MSDDHHERIADREADRLIALAWTNLEGNKFCGNGDKWKHADLVIPLYDRPLRDLTDEEIIAVWEAIDLWKDGSRSLIKLARAIIEAARGK